MERVASDADRYVASNGNFSFHQQGIIGFAAPGHRHLMADLHDLLTRISALGAESQKALRPAAAQYMKTDEPVQSSLHHRASGGGQG